jgi:hypothetical protein
VHCFGFDVQNPNLASQQLQGGSSQFRAASNNNFNTMQVCFVLTPSAGMLPCVSKILARFL